MLGLGGSATPMNNGALNLGAPATQQNPWANQQMMGVSQAPFMQGMFGGQHNPFMQQPVAPPSELEIQIILVTRYCTSRPFPCK